MAKKRKIRTEFRKNRAPRTRLGDWTKQFKQHGFQDDDPVLGERISGKGELTRHRTVMSAESSVDEHGSDVQLEVDSSRCRRGRVLSVLGLVSNVQAEDGPVFQCATRRLLKTLTTEQRHVVVAGDRVQFRPVPGGPRGGHRADRTPPRRALAQQSRPAAHDRD